MDDALGPLNLRPWELVEVTPADVEDMVRGYHRRERKTWEKMAWMVGHIIGVHPKKLLPRERRKSPEEIIEVLRIWSSMFGKEDPRDGQA